MSSPSLPAELWLQVFAHLSIIGEATYSSAPWDMFTRGAQDDKEKRLISESVSTKRALSLVSRHFYLLSRSIVLELITLQKVDHLRSLADSIRRNPELGTAMTRCTERLDICVEQEIKFEGRNPVAISTETSITYGEREMQTRWSYDLLRDMVAILRFCPSLKYLTYSRPRDLTVITLDPFVEALANSCPFIEILRWRFAPLVKLSSVIPSLVNLRVLDISMVAPILSESNIGIPELPHLHTISGPLDVICPAFASVRLPVLHTLICNRYGRSSIRGLTEFFSTHGAQITRLEHRCASVGGQPYLSLCTNVADLVVDWSDCETLHLAFPSIMRVGLAGVRTGLQDVRILLYVFDVLEYELDNANYPKLSVIRIVEKASANSVRRLGMNALRLYDRRMRGRSIKLEDDLGDRLVPLVTPQNYQVFWTLLILACLAYGGYLKCSIKRSSYDSGNLSFPPQNNEHQMTPDLRQKYCDDPERVLAGMWLAPGVTGRAERFGRCPLVPGYARSVLNGKSATCGDIEYDDTPLDCETFETLYNCYIELAVTDAHGAASSGDGYDGTLFKCIG
ncbi:hypothetical protein DFH11DRAFT_1547161 [Phellopilus nigrolimitatus]|nr:hypothetical protein DFH11DRAFT_1547161 [Phellopilus nigrolimitatus]